MRRRSEPSTVKKRPPCAAPAVGHRDGLRCTRREGPIWHGVEASWNEFAWKPARRRREGAPSLVPVVVTRLLPATLANLVDALFGKRMTEISPWLGLGGTALAAVLAFVFGRVQLGRTNEMEREAELRRRRVDVYADFCSAVVEYRRAQLVRWHERAHTQGTRALESTLPEVAQDLRARRSVAWSEYYKVLMICNDETVERLAREALRVAKRMQDSQSPEDARTRSDDAHRAIEQFARVAGSTVITTSKQRELAPPRQLATDHADDK